MLDLMYFLHSFVGANLAYTYTKVWRFSYCLEVFKRENNEKRSSWMRGLVSVWAEHRYCWCSFLSFSLFLFSHLWCFSPWVKRSGLADWLTGWRLGLDASLSCHSFPFNKSIISCFSLNFAAYCITIIHIIAGFSILFFFFCCKQKRPRFGFYRGVVFIFFFFFYKTSFSLIFHLLPNIIII